MTAPVHGPRPIDLRRGRRRWAWVLARFGAAFLGFLILLHLVFLFLGVFLFLEAGQSPTWRHGIAGLAGLFPEVGGWSVLAADGLSLLIAFACMAALWSAASRVAALLFLGAALYETWRRLGDLAQISAAGNGNPTLAYLGTLLALLSLFVALLALTGALFADRSSAGGLDGRRLG